MKRIHFKKIHSTHLYAKEHLDEFAHEPLTVITSDFQTGGIGRRRDKWIAPAGSSLLVSFVYKLPDKQFTPYLSQMCSVALKNALAPLDLPVRFKYPNDLLVNGKKLAGIISEVSGDMVITSAGLNLTQKEEQMDLIDQPATSLLIETGKTLSSEKILESLLHHFFALLTCNK